jgi:hypothetical protein
MDKPEKKKIAVGVDPGDMTGWVILEWDGGKFLYAGQTKADDFWEVLERIYKVFDVKVIVYEDFILFKNRAQAQTGSRFYASQVIGVIKVYAKKHETELVKQPSTILINAPKISGVEMKGSHDQSHYKSAYNHLVWWMVSHHRMPSLLQQELKLTTATG